MLGIDVELKAQDVSDRDAEGIRYQVMENKFVIVLDSKLNTSDEEALRTMRVQASERRNDSPDFRYR